MILRLRRLKQATGLNRDAGRMLLPGLVAACEHAPVGDRVQGNADIVDQAG